MLPIKQFMLEIEKSEMALVINFNLKKVFIIVVSKGGRYLEREPSSIFQRVIGYAERVKFSIEK